MEIKRFVLSDFEVNNYLLIEGKEAVLIDAGFDPEPIETYLLEKGIELKAILLTHAHLDHIGGLQRLRERFNAPVYIHQKEIDWLTDPELNGSKTFPFFGDVVCEPADYILKEGKPLKIGGFHFEVLHTPGHTPGGVSFYMKPWIFTGDTLFYRSIGRTDLYGGDQMLLLQTIENQLFSLPNETVVYPGHGQHTTIAEEKKWNPYCSVI